MLTDRKFFERQSVTEEGYRREKRCQEDGEYPSWFLR
jgi:hypothetical protein